MIDGTLPDATDEIPVNDEPYAITIITPPLYEDIPMSIDATSTSGVKEIIVLIDGQPLRDDNGDIKVHEEMILSLHNIRDKLSVSINLDLRYESILVILLI